MSTHKELQGLTKEQLGQRAKRRRIAGWENMKKTELVQALAPQPKGTQPRPKSASKQKSAEGKKAKKLPSGKAAAKVTKETPKPKAVQAKTAASKVKAAPAKVASKRSADPQTQRQKSAPNRVAGQGTAAKSSTSQRGGPAAVDAKSAKRGRTTTAEKKVTAKPVTKADPKSSAKAKLSSAAAAESSVKKQPKTESAGSVKPTAAKRVSSKGTDSGRATSQPGSGTAAVKRSKASPAAKGKGTSAVIPPSEEVQRLQQLQEQRERRKDLAAAMPAEGTGDSVPMSDPDALKDRVVLIVRDPFWLQATWDVTRRSVERAKVVMAEHWHTCRPVLRLLQLDDSGTTSATESVVRDIEIHGGVRNWYIEVPNPPSAFRVQLGYLTPNGRFHELAISNGVQTPPPGGQANVDDHWTDIAEDFERIYAQSGGYSPSESGSDLRYVFERQLKRSMGVSALTQFGAGAERSFRRSRGFYFELDAELLVFGSTLPDAQVTIDGRPVKLRSDGSFAERLPLPDRRQVLPATACSRDGVEQQTIVLAVERNTKVMEVLTKEAADDGG